MTEKIVDWDVNAISVGSLRSIFEVAELRSQNNNSKSPGPNLLVLFAKVISR